jgi:LysM repeat protein
MNNLPSAHELRVGQVLVIPVHGREATPPAAREGKTVHIVQSGEVLSEIARRYGVDMAAIIKANDLSSANALRVGQELIIPVVTPTAVRVTATATVVVTSTPTSEASATPGEAAPQATGAPPITATPTRSPTGTVTQAAPTPTVTAAASLLHIVRPGDTLLSIAKQYGVSIDALKAANPGIDPRALQVGQKIIIPAVGATPLPTATARSQPSATPASAVVYPAPLLLAPEDEASFGGINQEIVLRWAWDDRLGPDEWFDVQLGEKEGDLLGRVWTKEMQWRLPKEFFDGRWRWRIVVIRGVQGQSREEISPPSEIRHIDWH